MAGLDDGQRRALDDDGFVVVPGAIDPERWLDPLAAEYEQVLDRVAGDLLAAGRISSTYAELEFGPRFVQIALEANDTLGQFFDCSLPQVGVQPDTPFWFGPSVFAAITNPDLLDIVESVIGGEIYSNPVQHIRIKPPERRAARDDAGNIKLGATTWHQDNGVVLPIADDTDLLTVWFSLADAREEHGCLRVVPGSHRWGLLPHCPTAQGLEVPDGVADRSGAVPLPTRRGDVILLHKLTLHDSLPNVSDEIRWSLDLRYNPTGQPTGREAFPGFVARSRRDPSTELHDPQEWEQRWIDARAALAASPGDGPYHRWQASAEPC
jgi:hypothetical protein